MSDVMQIMFNSKIYKFDKICTLENVGRDGTRNFLSLVSGGPGPFSTP